MSQLIFIYCLMIRANVICFLQHSYNVTVILLQDNSFGVFNKKKTFYLIWWLHVKESNHQESDGCNECGRKGFYMQEVLCALVWMGSGVCPQAEFVW